MSQTRRNFLKYFAYTAGVALLVDAFWAEQYFIEFKEHYFKDATPENYSLKVVQISDLHLKSVNAQLRTLSEKINSSKPDLIVFTGDSVDEQDNLNLLDKFLSLLNKDIKKIAILGNWEYWGKLDLNRLKAIYSKHNCNLLVNEHSTIQINNKSVRISGFDDYVGGFPDFIQTMSNYTETDFHLVLNHCPGYNDEIIAKAHENNISISFILSGHTHGGQVNYFGLIPMLPEGSGKYVKGWYKKRDVPIYVSRGIGTSIYPVRVGARAEATVFYL